MSLVARHAFSQGPMLRSFTGLSRRVLGAPKSMPPLPAVARTLVHACPPTHLIADYMANVGGDASSTRGMVPAHLFPQWALPLVMASLGDLPWPLARAVNGGCHLRVHAPLVHGPALHTRVQLKGITDRERLTHVELGVRTMQPDVSDGLYATLRILIRKPTPKGPKLAQREPSRAPVDAQEIGRSKLSSRAGWAFACLTGDFNPVHWVQPYARAMGFRGCILHGFATMARTMETATRSLFAGDATYVRNFDCRFTRPVVLPANVGVYVRGQQLFMADAPLAPNYIDARFSRDLPTEEEP